MRSWRKLPAVFLAAALLFPLLAAGAAAEEAVFSSSRWDGTPGGNAYDQCYGTDYEKWSAPVGSYLDERDDGTFLRVQWQDGALLLERFSVDGVCLDGERRAPELPLFGGFFAGAVYDFFVFGQANPSEREDVEVLRVVKYDKAGNRLGQGSVYGANTSTPFDAGSLRMCETAGRLYIHTCHEMYTSDDGLKHQANMSFVFDQATMECVDGQTTVQNFAKAGYVSHSFNQFIATDGDYIYRVDHGDAFPRAVTLVRSPAGGSLSEVTTTQLLPLRGETGNNRTGTGIGGMALLGGNVLVAGSTLDQSSDEAYRISHTANLFVTVTDRQLRHTTVRYLTDYDEGDGISVMTPQLVALDQNHGLLLWMENRGGKAFFQSVVVDANGFEVTERRSDSALLSDCPPILCADGAVRWYVADDSGLRVYALRPAPVGGEAVWDVDGDGRLTTSDARLALRAAVRLEELSEAQLAEADADGDGEITTSDARRILRAAVRLAPAV